MEIFLNTLFSWEWQVPHALILPIHESKETNKQKNPHFFIARDKYLCVMFKKLLLDDQVKFSDILLPKTGCMNNLTLNIQCSKPVY